jgi:hypothetical protein
MALALVMAVVVMVSVAATDADAHPLHTTLAQLTYDPATGEMRASIRAFANDFAAAVVKRKGGAAAAVGDPEISAYLAAAFQLTDPSGRAIPWTWCGARREGDVVFLCVRAAHVPPAARISDQLLCELFDDQVNIVQAVSGARKTSNLYTKGDGAKPAF